MTEGNEWISSREGADLLGIPQSNYLYYAKNGDIAFRQGKRAREYSRADTLKVRRQLAAKNKRTAPEQVLIDWALAADVPATLKLSQQVYTEDVDIAEVAVYQSWRKHNSQLTLAAFSADRNVCYATIQVVPLEEQVILDVLSGKRAESSITPDEIRSYDEPGAYSLLVTSATCLRDRPTLLYQLFYRYMQFWLEMYPGRYITCVYAQAVSHDGMRIVQHFFMAPRPDLAYNAFMIDMAYPAAARMIREFKQELEQKAPLPDALQWPPIPR